MAQTLPLARRRTRHPCATRANSAQLVARTGRKRSITRWNRRLGVALVVVFPASYLVSWLHDQNPDGVLGSWLSAFNVAIQVTATLVLFTHAAYSFYVFGFPPRRANLRTINGYAAYVILLVFMLAQTAVGKEPMYTVLSFTAYVMIGIHVIVALILARRRPPSDRPTLKADIRTLVSPDAQMPGTRSPANPHPPTPGPGRHRLSVALGPVQVLFDVTFAIAPGTSWLCSGTTEQARRPHSAPSRAWNVLSRARSDGRARRHGPNSGWTRRVRDWASSSEGTRCSRPSPSQTTSRCFPHRLDRRTREERTAHVEASFPWLRERAGQQAGTLSGGEQQMLALTRAFLDPPAVLLVDEFSLGLAPRIVSQLVDLIRSVAATGTAVLLVEQSANVALQLASQVLVMERGRITLSEPSEVLRRSPDLLTRAYLAGTVEMAEAQA